MQGERGRQLRGKNKQKTEMERKVMERQLEDEG